jgi:hypothetical protein
MLAFFILLQCSGIYITMVHAVLFVENLKTEINAYHAGILIGTVRFLMSLLNVWLMKNIERRKLIMVSCLGMTGSMIVSGKRTKAHIHVRVFIFG